MNASANINEAQILDQISREHLWETTRTIAQWVRHSGTKEERESFNYIQQTLEKYGLRTTLLEHPALISYPLESSLAIIDEAGQVIRSIDCLGTSFGTRADNLEAEVVDLGFGTPKDYESQHVAGKIALLNGLATPVAVYRAEQAGAIGQIFINDDHLHYMIVSTIWGTPTPDSAGRLPSTPSISVTKEDGHNLRERISQGPVQVRVKTKVFTDWQKTPLLIADLDGTQSDDFVMFSGHVDSWEVGAMDNGSANATMLEVGRVLAQHQERLYRGLRLAFWSGHSHGRYAGSTWYADNFWEELHDHCVVHVNVDSTGARGATVYSNFPANLELGPFGASIIEEHTGQQTKARRMSRAGDMSFNGVGIPAIFMGVSQVPFSEDDTDYVSMAFGKLLGSKMPWWWHTSEDTIDKIDLDVLTLDTKIYLSTLWRLCHHPLLPMDFRPVVSDVQDTVQQLQKVVGDHLDLSLTLARAERLAVLVEELARRRVEAQEREQDKKTTRELNQQIKVLSRLLIPITYTAAGRFDHDPAWGFPHLPTLSDAQQLVRLDPASDDYHFSRTQLARNRNKVNFVLREAISVLADLATYHY
jgi:hypothetical protein